MKRIEWSIGKEGTVATNLESPPYRAFFRVFEGGELVDSFDLSESALEMKIEKGNKDDDTVNEYISALNKLRKHNK